MNGKCRGVDVGQTSNIVPGFLAILLLKKLDIWKGELKAQLVNLLYLDVARKVFKDETIHGDILAGF